MDQDRLTKALKWAKDAQTLTVAGQRAHPWLVADIVEHAPVLALEVQRLREALTQSQCYYYPNSDLCKGESKCLRCLAPSEAGG